MADDDFLHQLRTRPSAVFAARLKATLDRQNLRQRYALAGCVALLAAGVAVAMAIPQVRNWLGANAAQAHSSARTTAASATTSGVRLKSAPSDVATSESPHLLKTSRPATQAVAENAASSASSQTGAAPSDSQLSAAAGAAASPDPSLVGFVPEAMVKLYNAWADAYPKPMKLHLTLHPWQGDVHELPNDGTAAFIATSDSLSLNPVTGSFSAFPLLVEGVVPIVHLDGVNTADLVLDGNTLAGIFLGEITVWNDPRIVRLNPNLTLPPTPTLPVFHRGSAPSNAVFSGYLADNDQTFRNQVGRGTSQVWPVGTGGTDDSEIAAKVADNDGSIGYVDFDVARQHNLPAPRLINATGHATAATIASIQAGANLVCRALDFEQEPSQEPGAWPISSIGYVLISFRERQSGHVPTTNFFSWVVRNGGPIASGLNYAPLPDSLAQKLSAGWLQSRPCL